MLETSRIKRLAISREVNYNRGMRLPITTKINKIQRQIIVGTILGDGCLEFDGFHGTRLQIKQAERYKEYVFWLYGKLKNLCNSEPKQRNDTKQWYFSTKHLTELTILHRCFYPNGKKLVPKDISDILVSPLSLSVWYMDDGGLDYRPKDHYAFILNTDSFTLEGVNFLKELMDYRFGIASTIHNSLCRGKRYPKLYIGKNGREEFLKKVKPYILNCFSHKLPPI